MLPSRLVTVWKTRAYLRQAASLAQVRGVWEEVGWILYWCTLGVFSKS